MNTIAKRILSLACILAMLTSVTACKPGDSSSAVSNSSTVGETSSEMGTAADESSETGYVASQTDSSSSNPSGHTNSTGNNPNGNSNKKYTLPKVKLSNKKLKLFVGMHEDEKDWTSSRKDLPTAMDIYRDTYGGSFELIKTTWGDYNTNLLAMYLADEMPDLLYNVPWKFPKTYLSDFIQPVDGYTDYLNLNDSIWNDTRSYINKFKINGKTYYPVSGYSLPMMVMYNPQLFELYDLETPLSVYKKDPGKWTWATMLSYARELTVSQNGKVKQYGIGFGGEGASAMQYSTGVAIVDYDPNKGTVTHNLKHTKIADAANYLYDMNNKYKVVSNVRADEMRPEFIKGNIAMLVDYTWTAESTFAELWEDKLIECVPVPRYNASSKNYVDGRWTSWTIASKAKNPQGAALYIALAKYVSSDQYYTDRKTSRKLVKYMNNDRNKIPREQSDLILALESDYTKYPRVDGSTGVGFYDQGQYYPFTNEVLTRPWSQIVESIYPKLDAALKKNYEALKKAK